ncbi:hypothetical protein EAI_10031 [Harpegnathos saltator]|uniref:Uncharacterized protein n=1 Tax=Harpegnathos saltator TaxID=610380 RepID=E2BJ93_HARSA|nr:hypothetical protein EAI_10031 [Harpegnathos saltator]
MSSPISRQPRSIRSADPSVSDYASTERTDSDRASNPAGFLCAEGGEAEQPWLFGNGAAVDVEDVLLEVIRPAEVFAAEGAGEGVPGSETAALVPGVPSQGRFRPVSSSAH